MTSVEDELFFSVIIPTRNRVKLFKKALDSVLAQSFTNFEVIVVNDGSDAPSLEEYKQLEKNTPSNVKFRYQVKRPNGHGQSYSMNTGALVGKGKYLCFLDDDDEWTDKEHLTRAHKSIRESVKEVDAYYTNQKAVYVDGVVKEGPIWLDDLPQQLINKPTDSQGSIDISIEELLRSHGFAHLNCSIVRRELYLEIKGMDENIRWECDRDLYLRTLDSAQTLLYNPSYIALHLIPDTSKKENMTTMVNMLEKRLYQVTVYQKGTLLSKRKAVRSYCRASLGFIFQHITHELLSTNRTKDAAVYASKALACRFSIKWFIRTYWLKIKAMLS